MCTGSGRGLGKKIGTMIRDNPNKAGYFKSTIGGVDSSKPAVTPRPTVMSGLRKRDDGRNRKTLLGGR